MLDLYQCMRQTVHLLEVCFEKNKIFSKNKTWNVWFFFHSSSFGWTMLWFTLDYSWCCWQTSIGSNCHQRWTKSKTKKKYKMRQFSNFQKKILFLIIVGIDWYYKWSLYKYCSIAECWNITTICCRFRTYFSNINFKFLFLFFLLSAFFLKKIFQFWLFLLI